LQPAALEGLISLSCNFWSYWIFNLLDLSNSHPDIWEFNETPNTLFVFQNEKYMDVFSLPQKEIIAGKERLYLPVEEKEGYVYFNISQD
jgi:hypothetical protein